jgi:tRNA acetyltransferase TAN1
MKEFNLIATSDQINVSNAASELWVHLRDIGDDSPRVNRTGIKGIVKGFTCFDAVEAIHKLRSALTENPNKFKHIFRVIPIQTVVDTDVSIIVESVKQMADRIKVGESFRITLEKRRTNLRSQEIIEAAAEVIDRPVNLSNPDWVVLIEILGRETGISILSLTDTLNVQKEKFALSSQGK